jgi:hypothetical protein
VCAKPTPHTLLGFCQLTEATGADTSVGEDDSWLGAAHQAIIQAAIQQSLRTPDVRGGVLHSTGSGTSKVASVHMPSHPISTVARWLVPALKTLPPPIRTGTGKDTLTGVPFTVVAKVGDGAPAASMDVLDVPDICRAWQDAHIRTLASTLHGNAAKHRASLFPEAAQGKVVHVSDAVHITRSTVMDVPGHGRFFVGVHIQLPPPTQALTYAEMLAVVETLEQVPEAPPPRKSAMWMPVVVTVAVAAPSIPSVVVIPGPHCALPVLDASRPEL